MKIQPSFFFSRAGHSESDDGESDATPPTADERDNEESGEEEAQGLDSPPLASTTATGVSGVGRQMERVRVIPSGAPRAMP